MLGVGLALGASLCWGVADFLGGVASRRLSTFEVLLVSQPIGVVIAWALAAVFATGSLGGGEVALAVVAGLAVLVALGSFYRAMSHGAIGLVAMIAALGVLVPVIGGVVQGETPGTVQSAGAAVAVIGVLAAVGTGGLGPRLSLAPAGIALAVAAALGFGLFLLAIDGAAEADPVLAIAVARSAGLAGLVAVAVVLRPPLLAVGARERLPLVAIGVLEISANTLYAVATNHGLLPLVAVAGSLYAVVTIVLAWRLIGERMHRAQAAGVALALAGVAAIAAGG